MESLANEIADWLEVAGDAWHLGGDVVLWALPFGGDVERAWSNCPRADYLVALAALGGCKLDVVQREACNATRATPALCPGVSLVADLQRANEDLLGHPPPPPDDNLEAAIDEAVADFQAAADAAAEAAPAIDEAAEVHLAAALSALRDVDGAHEAKVDRCLEALAHDRLEGLRSAHDAMVERACLIHVLRAQSTGFALGVLAARLRADGRRVSELRHDRTTQAADLQAALVRYTKNECRFFSVAGELFRQCALAHAYAQRRGRETWDTAIFALLSARLEGDTTPPTDALRMVVDHLADETMLNMLASYAKRLRKHVAFGSLDFSGPTPDSEPVTVESLGETRSRLSEELRASFTEARKADDASVVDVIETAIAILDAPGELDFAALGPVMDTLHEHLANHSRTELRKVPGAKADRWQNMVNEAERTRLVFRSWARGSGQSN